MNIFLSARYSRRDELRGYRDVLKAAGHKVIARWLDTDWEEKDDGTGSSAAPAEYRAKHAAEDLDDVAMSDCFIAFTEKPRSNTRGGRHVEFGYALAKCSIVFVIGPMENIFHHHHHDVEHVQDIASVIDFLKV